MRFRIIGAKRLTGEDVDYVLAAADPDEAKHRPNAQGVVVASITQADEEPSYGRPAPIKPELTSGEDNAQGCLGVSICVLLVVAVLALVLGLDASDSAGLAAGLTALVAALLCALIIAVIRVGGLVRRVLDRLEPAEPPPATERREGTDAPPKIRT